MKIMDYATMKSKGRQNGDAQERLGEERLVDFHAFCSGNVAQISIIASHIIVSYLTFTEREFRTTSLDGG